MTKDEEYKERMDEESQEYLRYCRIERKALREIQEAKERYMNAKTQARGGDVNRQDKLNGLAEELEYWLFYDRSQQINSVGLDFREADTDEISPPGNPLRGTIKEWIKALRPSAAPIKHIGPDALFGPGELESMKREQE